MHLNVRSSDHNHDDNFQTTTYLMDNISDKHKMSEILGHEDTKFRLTKDQSKCVTSN